jgi:tetratricopeptide (TPR) repeat protein
MSYINEALKKAQKDKDAGYSGYMHSIKKSGRTKRSLDKKFTFLSFIFLLLIAFLLYIMFGGRAGQDIKNNMETPADTSVSKGQDTKINKSETDSKNLAIKDTTEQDSNDLKKINRIESRYKLAVSFFKEKKIKEAKDIYKEILLQDPGHINALNDMGVLSLHEGRYEDAVGYLEKAVKLKPRFANPFYNLACAYSLQDEGDKGMVYLLKAIEVDENVKDWAKQDPDLKNLREYPEFTLITK